MEDSPSPLHTTDPFHDGDNSLPPVHNRLSKLRPSRELLEYYRKKIAEYDSEHEELQGKLEKYKCAYEQLHKQQWELQLREDEIAQLQQALSDMQVYLFQEREQVLRLYAENDRLKIRELEDRKKIQHLLTLTSPVSSETTYFHKEPPAKVLIVQHHSRKPSTEDRKGISSHPPPPPPYTGSGGRGPGGHKKVPSGEAELNGDSDDKVLQEKETLLLTVEALKAQLEEQTRLCKEQVDALLEDRRVRLEEAEARRVNDVNQLKSVSDQLLQTRGLLYDSTKDFLDLKYELRGKERAWMGEKDELMRELDRCKEQLTVASSEVDPLLDFSCQDGQPKMMRSRGMPVTHLQLQLQQTQQLADNYREQCIKMEEEVARLKEESEVSKGLFKDRTDRMTKRLGLMNTRYEALEKRRGFEIEGYKNDIKLLRQRLNTLEKQLYKLTLTLSGNQDMEILGHVRQTAIASKKLVGDLQALKAKVYSLENSFRHVHDK